MKILIDGLNLELTYGTGIKAYARCVIAALASLGHKVDVLSQQDFPSSKRTDPLDAYLAARAAKGRKNFLTHIFTLIKSFWGKYQGDIDLCSAGSQWQNIDRLRVSPGIFWRSYLHSCLGLGAYAIPKSKYQDNDMFFLTSPIPIYMPGKINILTVLDVYPLSHPELLGGRYRRLIAKIFGNGLKSILAKADKVICISDTTRKELIARFNVDAHKLHVVYLPCRYDAYTVTDHPIQSSYGEIRGIQENLNLATSLKENKNLNSNDFAVGQQILHEQSPYILYIGTIEPKKNVLNLLKAIQLDNTLPKLIIIGSLGWSSDAEKLMIAELSANERVLHLGFVTDEEVKCWQKHAKAFVFPSITEGFGLPPLEVMWYGVPCVLSDIPVFRELFAEHAIFADQYNPAAIAQGIQQALKDDKSAADARMAFVRRTYSQQAFVASINKVITA